MRCSPVLLGALADGELRGWRAWSLRRHLAHCPACQQELTALEGLGQSLRTVSPLPTRKPIRRPIGIVRPAAATLALAGVAGALCLRLPGPSEPRSVAVAPHESAPLLPVPPPRPKATQEAVSAPPPVSRKARPTRLRLARRKQHHRPLAVAKATPRPKPEQEQIIVVATALPSPKPVTVVLNDSDSDGGTIHIESTIPAAYVVAMQKEQN